MTEEIKRCMDCKWSKKYYGSEPKCERLHTTRDELNYYTGQTTTKEVRLLNPCSTERNMQVYTSCGVSLAACGHAARFFEPKEEEALTRRENTNG